MNGIVWIAQSPWAYPALEAAHITGIALLFGNLVLFEWRVWGGAKALPLQVLARAALPIAGAGFALAAVTGLAMFASQPAELLANRVFVVKMGLVMLAGCNAAFFHARGSLAGPGAPDATAKALTVVSLGLWLAVIILGRWIAYV